MGGYIADMIGRASRHRIRRAQRELRKSNVGSGRNLRAYRGATGSAYGMLGSMASTPKTAVQEAYLGCA